MTPISTETSRRSFLSSAAAAAAVTSTLTSSSARASSPAEKVVVGVMGVDGNRASDVELQVREAEAAVASLPEFVGNVAAVRTAPFWDDRLGAIEEKKGEVNNMAWMLRRRDPGGPNADGRMTAEEQRRYVADYESELISPEEEALLKRGASAPGYHYLGCAKIFAQIGEAFAEAVMQMKRTADPPPS